MLGVAQVSAAQLGSLARLAAGQPLASTTSSSPSGSSSNGSGSDSSAEGEPSTSGTEFRGAATSVADGTGRFGELTLDEFRCGTCFSFLWLQVHTRTADQQAEQSEK